MAITNKYDTQKDQIVTYNYTDIIESTGYVIMSAYTTREGTVKKYNLGRDDVYSNEIETDYTDATLGVTFDLDFDTSTMNLPLRIRGKGKIVHSFYGTTASGTGYNYRQFHLRKWDGTTETDIVSVSGAVFATGIFGTEVLSFDIPPTLLKKGEILRLTAQGYQQAAAGGANHHYIAHDPKDRDGATIAPSTTAASTTRLEFHMPVNLDQ